MLSSSPCSRLVLGALLVGASAYGCQRGPQAPPPSAPSPIALKTLPDFDRVTLGGIRVDTHKLRGQVVVIKFFAEYCEPCKRTLPATERLHRKHPEVAFLGISEDQYPAAAITLVHDFKLSFPVVHDRGNVLAGRFRVQHMPTTFVVDSGGVVRWVGGPEQSENDLAVALAAYDR